MRLNLATLETVAHRRKMVLDDLLSDFGGLKDGPHAVFERAEDVERLASALTVSMSHLLVMSEGSDLQHGVKVCRADEGYVRTASRQGKRYYTYHHLVTTSTAPDLMPLRVELHCDDPASVELNGGHLSREVIYVTEGSVAMEWDTEEGRHESVLHVGDSAYLEPGISHSFRAAAPSGAELIAFNCGPSPSDFDLLTRA